MFKKILIVLTACCLYIQNANALGHSVISSSSSSSVSSQPASSSSATSKSSSSSSVTSQSSSSSISSQPVSSSSSSTSATYVAQIVTIAATSSCIDYDWVDRGVAPRGYIKGMALAYGRSLCRLSSSSSVTRGPALVMDEGNTGDDTDDALAWYNSNFEALGINNSSAGPDTLRSVYTLQIGLGMQESSGAYCTGHDTTAGAETAAEAETGAFQVSYNSFDSSNELSELYTEYQNDPNRCMLDIWEEGATDLCTSTDAENIGSGAGVEFQAFTKSCPAFGAEYADVLLRVLGGSNGEFGPIDRKAAELNDSCYTMLGQVETLVLSNEDQACSDLNADGI